MRLAKPSEPASPTILVVEDEPSILELIRINLVDAGYEVRAAPDAESGQAMLREPLPDLVLLDWMLPGHVRPRAREASCARTPAPASCPSSW